MAFGLGSWVLGLGLLNFVLGTLNFDFHEP